ncbi:MAG: trypsin-like serine protease [Firmicutes bacterium]|nr:trypsin-like serine protease [Bacillota bacterium]
MKKEHKNKISDKKIIIITITCTVLLSIISGSTIWLLQSGKINILSDNKENVVLKHTKETTVKSDGVYITDVSEVVDEVMPSIVSITSKTVISSGRFGPSFYNESYTTEGAGSGVIISENDDEIFILTNYHVVEDSTELSVKFIDDKSYDAKVKGISERKDIAVVSVSKKSIESDTLKQIKIATLGNSNDLKVGNGIIAIGNALGYGQSVTTGVVSALNREVSTDEYVQDMIQIDAAINGGNSGGALLNSKGEVVGINSVKYSSNSTNSSASIEGMGFAIPISDVEEIIKNLIKGKNDESGVSLGIEGYMTDSNYNLPEGFYISAISSNSNASKSELEIGNIITEIDNNKVTSIDTLRKVLNKKNKGDKVTLKIKYASRNTYKEKEITISLK